MKNILKFNMIVAFLLIFANISYGEGLISMKGNIENNRDSYAIEEYSGDYGLVMKNDLLGNNKASKIFNSISDPLFSGILLVIAIAAFVIEIFLPTFGIAGLISGISLLTFFIGNFYVGNVEIINLILFVIGCVLLAIEIMIPGFSLPGIAGIICIVIGIVLSVEDVYIGLISISIAIIIGFLTMFICIKKGFNSKYFNKIVLKKEIDSSTSDDRKNLLGMTGTALTNLRPAGTVEIDNKKINVVTEGDFIEIGTKVVVTQVEGFKIIVKKEL